MKKITILGVVFGLLPVVALAAYIGAGDSVAVPPALGGAQAAAQNAYLVGGTVNVSNPVSGDVMAAGGTIVISGKVGRDIFAVGGNMSIVSGSAEDIRVAGGNITIGEKISGEIMAAGGQISVTADANIAKDSYIAGGTIVFAGTENGDLTLAGGQIHIDGTVNGNLMIKRANKVVFGPQAVVKGTVEYSAPEEAVVSEGAHLASPPTFHKIQSASQGLRPALFAGLFEILFFLKLIATLAAAYLLWYLRREDMTSAIESVHGRFWSALFSGFVVLVLIPIAGIILLFTVVGWVPAAVMLAAYGALLALVAPVSVIVTASILMAIAKKGLTDLKWYHVLGGLIVLKLLALIPVLGWLACFVIYLVSLGATAKVLKAKFAK